MLLVNVDEVDGFAVLEPDGPLSQKDFENAAKEIDPYIERTGRLKGLIIHTRSFPGWESFAAMITHFKFVKDHNKKIYRVAISTDSIIGTFAESIASHFVNAEIKSFSFQDFDQARDWVAAVTDK